jgi:hypothetical protein
MAKLSFWSELREGEWLLKAYCPRSTNQPVEWTVYVYQDDKLVRQVKLPIDSSIRFGPDAGEVAQLNEALATLLKELVASKIENAQGKRRKAKE